MESGNRPFRAKVSRLVTALANGDAGALAAIAVLGDDAGLTTQEQTLALMVLQWRDEGAIRSASEALDGAGLQQLRTYLQRARESRQTARIPMGDDAGTAMLKALSASLRTHPRTGSRVPISDREFLLVVAVLISPRLDTVFTALYWLRNAELMDLAFAALAVRLRP